VFPLWSEEYRNADQYSAAYHNRPRYPVHEELKKVWKVGENKVDGVDFEWDGFVAVLIVRLKTDT